MGPDVVEQKTAEGVVHLECVAKLYRKPYNKVQYFVHEHPAGATSWHHPAILGLRELPGVGVAKADQCMCGLKTKGDTS